MAPVIAKAVLESRQDEGDATKGDSVPTWGSALMENMMDNLQVTIKNIHLRFEEDTTTSLNNTLNLELYGRFEEDTTTSLAPEPFAAGVCIEEFKAYTVDPKDAESKVFSKDPKGWLKRFELKGFSIYFDSGIDVPNGGYASPLQELSSLPHLDKAAFQHAMRIAMNRQGTYTVGGIKSPKSPESNSHEVSSKPPNCVPQA